MKKFTQFVLILSLMFSISISAFAQETLKKITERGELRVGMTANQPPFTMKANDGSIIGYEADLAYLLAATMDVKLNIVELPFHELLDAVINDKVDIVMSGMTMTMKRNMKVAFAGPYLLSGKSILSKSASVTETSEANDLNENTIKLVALKGSTSEDFVRSDIPDAELILANSYEEAIQALEDGSANIMVADYPICAYTAMVYPEKGLTTIAEPLTIEPIGMALPPNDAHFHNLIQNYLSGLELVGALEILEIKWFETSEWVELVK